MKKKEVPHEKRNTETEFTVITECTCYQHTKIQCQYQIEKSSKYQISHIEVNKRIHLHTYVVWMSSRRDRILLWLLKTIEEASGQQDSLVALTVRSG